MISADLLLSSVTGGWMTSFCLSIPMQRVHEDGECNPEAMKFYNAQNEQVDTAEDGQSPFAALKDMFK